MQTHRRNAKLITMPAGIQFRSKGIKMNKKILLGTLLSATLGLQVQLASASCVITDDVKQQSLSQVNSEPLGFIIGLKTPANIQQKFQVSNGVINVAEGIVSQQRQLSQQLANMGVEIRHQFKLI